MPEFFFTAEKIGDRIARLRQLVGMTQLAVAEATKPKRPKAKAEPSVTVETISRFERGNRVGIYVDEALNIAAAMKIHPLALMLGTEGKVTINGESHDVAAVWDWFSDRGRPLTPKWEGAVTAGMAPWLLTTPQGQEIAQETTRRILAEREAERENR